MEAAYPGQGRINVVPPSPLFNAAVTFSICAGTYPINYHDLVIRCKKYKLPITLLTYVLDTENHVHRIQYYSLLQNSITSLGPTQTHTQRLFGGS